jgi:hypothetical protein
MKTLTVRTLKDEQYDVETIGWFRKTYPKGIEVTPETIDTIENELDMDHFTIAKLFFPERVQKLNDVFKEYWIERQPLDDKLTSSTYINEYGVTVNNGMDYEDYKVQLEDINKRYQTRYHQILFEEV